MSYYMKTATKCERYRPMHYGPFCLLKSRRENMKSEIYWKGVPGSAWSIWDKTMLYINQVKDGALSIGEILEMLEEEYKIKINF